MVEFGEQLRRAREAKGMTQQSLAEQLYVTRQAVSRWECGDRYPDLLTTKKIAQILDVSLDDLLSGKEMTKVVERNPVIENKIVNNIMIVLYAFVVLSFLLTVVDIVIRFPFGSDAVDYSDIQITVIQILGLVIQIVAFSYGLFNAVRGTLSPKRMGAVLVAFFAAICITGSENLGRFEMWQMMISGILFIIVPGILGAVASYYFFVRGDNRKIWIRLIDIVSVWGIFRIIFSNFQMIRFSSQYLSMNTTVRIVLTIGIYALILYQTRALSRKRENAIKTSNDQE
ncbi:XRE family transcriptional regulator [Butyrivibrio sp. XB500-5]|uniref:helix-turn-helix domain-containing protein n=1 Tax=Butyrivibrio sp. XB500-5 TaxID=2364880 RepID=UPI000EA88656|nr:helix-turn-helix transcriptional regulator [Butyrivibrio sp. XB500-5]RKM61621.1 XRE family transcriptional regulator [Butyrivibrio sp. XB500-5]